MSILETFGLALKNIASSKTRSLLTMLGIIIGVAAVIVIVGLGNGLEKYMTDSLSGLGTDTLTVSVMSRGSTRSLSPDDMYGIVEENSRYLALCSPTVSMPGMVKIGSDTLSSTSVQGVSLRHRGNSGVKFINVAEEDRVIGVAPVVTKDLQLEELPETEPQAESVTALQAQGAAQLSEADEDQEREVESEDYTDFYENLPTDSTEEDLKEEED